MKSSVKMLAISALCAAVGTAAADSDTVGDLGGVYKDRFQNGLVSGETFQSENILEVVPYKPGLAYFRIHLEFYNGHECNISGIASASSDRLVYRGPADFRGNPCVLTIHRSADGIHIFENDNLSCKNQTCGERGGYGYSPIDDPVFKLTERRPIRYTKRILASQEYSDAIAEYEKSMH
jgi:hypothetical protein